MTTPLDGMDGVVCDLDGVVYRGATPVEHAIDALGAVRRSGLGIVYATNNASRPPADVASQLRDLGLELADADVVTSSQAGARHLAECLPAGARVLAVGGPGVGVALTEAGLTPVRPADAAADPDTAIEAVLQGLGHDVTWSDLAEAAHRINGGATWVATNADMTLPTARGIAPGNGSLVGCVRAAVAIDPVVVGKPETPLYELAAHVVGSPPERTLAIGDRLDTDIVGAGRTTMPSLYVATGVSSVADVALADGDGRPTYLAADLRALGEDYVTADVRVDRDAVSATCGDAVVDVTGGGIGRLEDSAGSAGFAHRMRAFVAAVWAARDAGTDLDADAVRTASAWVEQGAR